jgi:hypothetical protein
VAEQSLTLQQPWDLKSTEHSVAGGIAAPAAARGHPGAHEEGVSGNGFAYAPAWTVSRARCEASMQELTGPHSAAW